MKKICLLCQHANPKYGSEYAAGWSTLKALYLDRLYEKFQIDIFISSHSYNSSDINRVKDQYQKKNINFYFVPNFNKSKLHKYFGALLRIFWQIKVFFIIKDKKYDFVHQISPNSIIYLNPIFLFNNKIKKIIGPMRSDSFINLKQIYFYSLNVFIFQIFAHIKQFIEFVLCFFHRKAILKVDLYLDPIPKRKLNNSVYCPETSFIKTRQNKNNNKNNKYLLIWSGTPETKIRKGYHLVMKVIQNLNKKKINNYEVLILGLMNKKSNNINFKKKLPRSVLLSKLDNRVIYLMTSLRELNSVLVKEVLENNGQVIAAPLVIFNKNNSKNFHLIKKYSNIDEWCNKIISILNNKVRNNFESNINIDQILKKLDNIYQIKI